MQNSSNTSSYDAYLNSINNQMTYYFVVISSAIGIPGNLISMFIFIRLAIKNPKINMGFLYTCQTIIDLLVLIFTLFVFRGSVYLFGYLVMNISDSYCRGFMFFRRFIVQASSWMSVLIIFDRFIFVLYEHRFKFMKNKLILSAIIFGVMLLLAISDVENLFYYVESSSKSSLFTCTGRYEITIASDIIAMVVRIHIPLVLMAIFNGLVINRISKSSTVRSTTESASNRRKERQFTIAAMLCNVLFFFTNFPLAIFYIVYDINLYSGVFKSNSTVATVYTFYMNVCINVSFFVQTLSVFIYFGFNKLFRNEFFIVICKLFPCSFCDQFNFESSIQHTKASTRNKDMNSLSGKN